MTAEINAIADWYLTRGPGFRSFVKSVQTFAVLYGGAILENQVQVISAGGLLPRQWWHAGVLFGCVLILGILSYHVRVRLKERETIDRVRRDTLAYASSLADQYSTFVAAAVCRTDKTSSSNELASALVTSVDRLQRIVGDAYQLFEARYGESWRVAERIDFEATFMTRSYLDGEITIPAFANRSGRAPTSLLERVKDPKLYERTETAQLYRDRYPRLRLISDTTDEAANYAELYPDQKKRIRSSVVAPVLSPTNELLGTLVVHCNRPQFFVEADRRFWEEMTEIFTRRLTLEKVKLDALIRPETQSYFGLSLVGLPF